MNVNKVAEFFQKEANAQKPLLPLCQAQKWAGVDTGVSINTIQDNKKVSFC